MNSFLLNRETGRIAQTLFERAQSTRLIYALQPMPSSFTATIRGTTVVFDGSPPEPLDQTSGHEILSASSGRRPGSLRRSGEEFNELFDDPDEWQQLPDEDENLGGYPWVAPPKPAASTVVAEKKAHDPGVTSVVVDHFEGRFLLSGGANGIVYLWDLQRPESPSLRSQSITDVEGSRKRPLEATAATNMVNRRTLHYFYYRPIGELIGDNELPAAPPRRGQPISRERNPPYARVQRTGGHRFGITHISFSTFDRGAFLTSSYDHTLKLSHTETMTEAASYNMGSIVYSHAVSPIASHLLVACATQGPGVRLVDLKSGANIHTLPGHTEAVLSVAWSPREEHVLASGSVDGTVRLWDIRRSTGALAVLDMEHIEGMTNHERNQAMARRPVNHRTHAGPVNGVIYTDRGHHIVTVGHDDRVRVWNAATTANTLASFGPLAANTRLATKSPLLVPGRLLPPGKEIMFYANHNEILMFDLFQGTLLKRLRPLMADGSTAPALSSLSSSSSSTAKRTIKASLTSLAWRAGSVQIFSGHSDGIIRTWMPRTRDEDELDEAELREIEGGASADDDDEDRNPSNKRKKKTKKRENRRVLDGIYRDLTEKRLTFGRY